MDYEEGHAGGEEPEAGSTKLVEEGEGTLDLLDFGDGDFVGDAVTLDYAEGGRSVCDSEIRRSCFG